MKHAIDKPLPVDEYAKKAYDAGQYVEAIQLLHGYLEMRMRESLMLLAANFFNSNLGKVGDSCNEISYREIVRILWILNYINDEEKNDLIALNRLRNEVIHELFSDDHDGIGKNKYDQIYKKSIKLVIEMDNKNLDLLG